MFISGMSGNEIFCLSQKGFEPGEIAVGNSVCSLGFAGALGSIGRSVAGGEITQVTQLISEGRHAAIARMEGEAQRHGAQGVTGVASTLGRMAGYTEFLAQGTAVHTGRDVPFFSTAASGIGMYCHLDAGYQPRKFVMGNIAYALGIGRGLSGSLRTLARGEVREFSSMYNEIRHTALARLRHEAAHYGGNAVVDVDLRMLPYGPGTVELLMTGTASFHPRLSPGPVPMTQVVTSELGGEELWNLATMGYVPHQLVMGTSVYSLGVAAGIGTLFQAISRGELPEVTKLIYEARENAVELVRREATALGADRVIGNRLQIREIGAGMVEVVAIGTAVKRAQGMEPETPMLIPQAVIVDEPSRDENADLSGMPAARIAALRTQMGQGQAQGNPVVALIAVMFLFITFCCAGILPVLFAGR